ncbi:hypothetical protein CHS0354_031513 [Potamilus streckersoni]|uniref:Sushi domain-containing protein n=1 Tax=Potamilus streckersoni TaxID=2493646 RepID=A0AAE0VVV0_9BIVA|nr:hypothetical protein CHS0354_031513 [Potamilus streckersoni]
MLEVAKRAGTLNRYNTVIFVSFDLGEDNLKGSTYFAKEWLPRFLASKYNVSKRTSMNLHGFYILDTIVYYNNSVGSQKLPSGLTEDMINSLFPEVYSILKTDNFQGNYIHSVYGTSKYDSLDVPLLKAWESLSAPKYKMGIFPLSYTDVDFLLSYDLRDIVRSDHASFWKNYLPALYLTDSGNYRGVMTNCYHQPCDNLDVMLTEDNLMFMGKQADALYYSLHYLAETDCGIPPGIMNSTYSISEDSLTAIYRCIDDTVVFPYKSNTNLSCMISGEWSQVLFVCVDSRFISGTDSIHAINGCPRFLVLLATLLLLMLV